MAASRTSRARAVELMPLWLFLFLLANVVEDAATGLSGLALGDRILAPLDVTPLNGRFVGALYVAGGVGILLGALGRRTRDARAILAAFLVIAVLVECLTFVYWSDFTRDGIPYIWLITYTVDPIVLVLAFTWLGLWTSRGGPSSIVAPALLFQTVVFGVAGIALLVGTGRILGLWPWTLTALVARVYASFFLAVALGALVAVREPGSAGARTILASSFTLAVLAMLASALHLTRLEAGFPKAAWFAGAAVVAAVSAAALVRLTVHPARAPAGRPRTAAP